MCVSGDQPGRGSMRIAVPDAGVPSSARASMITIVVESDESAPSASGASVGMRQAVTSIAETTGALIARCSGTLTDIHHQPAIQYKCSPLHTKQRFRVI
jgi:hypothetical protein